MNIGPPHDLDSWFISHGTPTLFGNDSPSNTSGCSIWMWSYGGAGEGVFTCVGLEQGRHYEICLWVRNTNADASGHLQVWLMNGLAGTGDLDPDPSGISGGQLADSSWTNAEEWTQMVIDVVPDNDYGQLLIYPYRASFSMGFGDQYELQIDDIRVSPMPAAGDGPVLHVDGADADPCTPVTAWVTGVATGADILWSPSDGLTVLNDTMVLLAPCTSTLYSATAQGTSLCPNACTPMLAADRTDSAWIQVPEPMVTALVDGTAICGSTVKLRALVVGTPCGSGEWIGPDGAHHPADTIMVEPLVPEALGPYIYRITTPVGGCTYDAATVTVVPQGTMADHFMPNAFSPNGDGINDVFVPVSAFGFTEYRLLIFDRWGGVLRQMDDATHGWDGTVAGVMVPGGVYAWHANYRLACDEQGREASGHVLVLR